MIEYIIGISIGSIINLSFLIGYIIWMLKKRSFKKLVKDIGQSSEDKINLDIKIWAKHTKNKFIPASLYKYNKNKVFEVDSIIVTSVAIIVVEIKSIKGVVKGKATDPKWTKILNNQNFYIANPIIQNDKHIEHIVKMTNMKVPIVSLIIFSNRTEYLDIQNIPQHVVIVRHIDLFHKLDQINAFLASKLAKIDIKKLTYAIKSYRSNILKDKKLHKKITKRR